MQFLLLIYTDAELLRALPTDEYDQLMRGCLEHADALRERGVLLDSQQLEPAEGARTLRVRSGQAVVTDGPFAETKEMLAGFNLIAAASLAEAVQIAHEFPWARFGSIEVRPVHDMGAERARVGASGGASGGA